MKELERIAAIVAGWFDVTVKQIRGKRRYRRFVIARHVFMFVCHERAAATYLEIGKFLRRDYTSVYHGVSRMRFRIRDAYRWVDRLAPDFTGPKPELKWRA